MSAEKEVLEQLIYDVLTQGLCVRRKKEYEDALASAGIPFQLHGDLIAIGSFSQDFDKAVEFVRRGIERLSLGIPAESVYCAMSYHWGVMSYHELG